jgi:hypothetical protein
MSVPCHAASRPPLARFAPVPVLDLEVSLDLLGRWTTWLAPIRQPFFVEDRRDWPEAGAPPPGEMTAELRDTFKVWRLRERGEVVWFDEASFMAMSRGRRARLVREQERRRRGAVPSVRRWIDLLPEDALRAQADGHRFVWWPSLLAVSPTQVLERFVADEADATRHRGAAATTWGSCAAILPRARELAGTFADGSGPNCFGTVLAAAGVDGAAEDWVQQEAFEDWLARSCARGGTDGDVGTVLVWRDSAARPVHAAVTIGDGLALEKAAQTWWTPRIVASVDEVKRASRAPGQRLERHRVAGEVSVPEVVRRHALGVPGRPLDELDPVAVGVLDPRRLEIGPTVR